MKKVILSLYSFIAILVMFACDDSEVNNDKAVFKVVLEATGEDYTAKSNVLNTNNVSLIDETTGTDLKQASISENFSGEKVYSTSEKVQYFSAQGIIISNTSATLKMTVYQDGKEIYQNTVSVPDSDNDTKSMVYTNFGE